MQQLFYVDKRSGTSADTLLAVGFARLLSALDQKDVSIRDEGALYSITCTYDPVQIIQNQQPLNLLRPISTAKHMVANGFDYEGQRARRDAYHEAIKALPSKLRSIDAIINQAPELEAFADQKPDPTLPLYLKINQMKVAGSFNAPIKDWEVLPISTKNMILGLLIDLFGTTPNPYAAVYAHWSKLARAHNLKNDMTMLQVVNPTTGKGANRSKADSLTIGGMDEWWVLEWLKFIGFFLLAHPQTIRESKDRKTYMVKPREIGLYALVNIVDTFREIAWTSTPAKMDVLALLRLVQVLIAQEKDAINKIADFAHRKKKPVSDAIHGCEVVTYKDMGSAYAVLNVAALNIPEWIKPIKTKEDAEAVEQLLEEHLKVIQSIQASDGSERSDEYTLLTHYRDFLSGRTIDPFLEFCALFAPYLSRKIEKGEWIDQFTISGLTRTFEMHKSLKPIIESKGFRNIADAIYRSTIKLQLEKANNKRPAFDIRYGLTQDLVRRSHSSEQFIEALTEFVGKYNSETAQTIETTEAKSKRVFISQQDLDDIVHLLDQKFSAGTIARMLVAYGTAKKDRTDKYDQNNPDNSEDNSLND